MGIAFRWQEHDVPLERPKAGVQEGLTMWGRLQGLGSVGTTLRELQQPLPCGCGSFVLEGFVDPRLGAGLRPQGLRERAYGSSGELITSLPISIPLSTVQPNKLPVSIPLASVVLPSRAERAVSGSQDGVPKGHVEAKQSLGFSRPGSLCEVTGC